VFVLGQAVIDREHIGFLANEMAVCNPSSLSVADALRYKAPGLRGKGAASGPDGKVVTLDACLAFVPKATFLLNEEKQATDKGATTHMLHLKGGARGGGRKAAKKGKTRLPIGNEHVLQAVGFLTVRQHEDCDGKCARGFVVGALPGPDVFSKLALAQMLVKHGVATVDTAADVHIDASEQLEDQEASFAQADTLCNLSVQQRDAATRSKEL
jgi:hypothetical protein